MDILSALQLLAAIIMVMFLPGFLLVNLMFPAKGQLDVEMDMLYRIGIGMVMSIFTVIAAGIFLNELGVDSTGHGYITGTNLWILLSIISVFFFIGGWYRGAYPWLGEFHRKLYREPAKEALVPENTGITQKTEKVLAGLMKEKKRLMRFIETAEEMERKEVDMAMIKEWSKRRVDAISRLEEVNAEIDRLRRVKKAKRIKAGKKRRKKR